MTAPNSRTPNVIIILINVDVKPLGPVQYRSFFLFNQQPAPDTVTVRMGDRVGWYVRILSKNLPATLPYELTFADSAVFGVSSLQVPAGGGSGYLIVLPNVSSLKTKYTLSVSGITPVYDPEIQTDNSGPFEDKDEDDENDGLPASANYVVTWQPDVDAHTLMCTKDTVAQSFPLTVSPGDVFHFQATANPAPEFGVAFDQANRYWQSPFDPSKHVFVGTPDGSTSSSTRALTVGDVTDSNKQFKFNAGLQDGTKSSDTYIINVQTN